MDILLETLDKMKGLWNLKKPDAEAVRDPLSLKNEPFLAHFGGVFRNVQTHLIF